MHFGGLTWIRLHGNSPSLSIVLLPPPALARLGSNEFRCVLIGVCVWGSAELCRSSLSTFVMMASVLLDFDLEGFFYVSASKSWNLVLGVSLHILKWGIYSTILIRKLFYWTNMKQSFISVCLLHFKHPLLNLWLWFHGSMFISRKIEILVFSFERLLWKKLSAGLLHPRQVKQACWRILFDFLSCPGCLFFAFSFTNCEMVQNQCIAGF